MLVNSKMGKCKDLEKCSLKTEIDTKGNLEAICLGEKGECFHRMGKYVEANGNEDSLWEKSDST